jgi:hypothetical protein
MWVSQTYLGCPDSNAKLFVYYLWEDYKRQKDVPKSIVDRLVSAGRTFGDDVSLFAPISVTQHEIRSELRSQGYDFFWREIGPNTPGLLLTEKRLSKFEPHIDEYVFFKLPNSVPGNEELIESVFNSLHNECETRLKKTDDETKPGLLDTICDSAQLKLTFMGLGIDFKPIISRFSRRR